MRRSVLALLAALVLVLAATPAWAHWLRGPGPRIDRAADVVPVRVEPAQPAAASPGRDRPGLARAGAPRSAVGAAEVTGALLVALGLVGLARAWRRGRRPALAVMSAALLLGFTVEITPHLVHHGLDADQGTGCEVLQAAERSQVASSAVDAPPIVAEADLLEARPVVMRATLPAPAPRGRAPPV